MTRCWVAHAIKLDDLNAYLLSCDDKLNLEVKCREFVRLVSSVLIAPVADSAVILMKAEERKVGSIFPTAMVQKLKEHGFEVGIKIGADYELLINCYRFTVIARLSPKWNPVGTWLVQGADFLSHEKGHAIRFDLITSSQTTSMILNVENIKFFPIQVEDLDVSTETMKNFRSHCTVITEYSICSNQCFVLPGLTEAYVYSVSHQIPPSSEFSTYDAVRLNWKKKHGIILPEKPGLYYQVFFTTNPENILTYPECCVYKSQPIVFPSRVADTVSSAFISDINARFPLVCGQTVSFSPATVPNTPLLCADIQKLSGFDPTSSDARYLQSHKNDADENVSKQSVLGINEKSSESSGFVNALCKDTAVPTVFEAQGVQQHTSTDTPMDKKHPEVKKHIHIGECPDTTHSEENSNAKVLGCNPMVILKSQDGTPKTCQPHKDLKTNTIEEIKKKILKSKVSVLKEWLHSNGIKFQTSDKKETLVKLTLIHVLKTGKYI